jgi:hypothetical protein
MQASYITNFWTNMHVIMNMCLNGNLFFEVGLCFNPTYYFGSSSSIDNDGCIYNPY